MLKTRAGRTGEHLQTLGTVTFEVCTSKAACDAHMNDDSASEAVTITARRERRRGRKKAASTTEIAIDRGEPIPLALRQAMRGFDTTNSSTNSRHEIAAR